VTRRRMLVGSRLATKLKRGASGCAAAIRVGGGAGRCTMVGGAGGPLVNASSPVSSTQLPSEMILSAARTETAAIHNILIERHASGGDVEHQRDGAEEVGFQSDNTAVVDGEVPDRLTAGKRPRGTGDYGCGAIVLLGLLALAFVFAHALCVSCRLLRDRVHNASLPTAVLTAAVTTYVRECYFPDVGRRHGTGPASAAMTCGGWIPETHGGAQRRPSHVVDWARPPFIDRGRRSSRHKVCAVRTIPRRRGRASRLRYAREQALRSARPVGRISHAPLGSRYGR